MTTQDALLVVVVAGFVALAAVIWAAVVARIAIRGRRALTDAVQALGAGDFAYRLDENRAGPRAAATFNQVARDLGERLESGYRSAEILRQMAASFPGTVCLDLNPDGEVVEVLGDLETLIGHRPEGVIGRHASYFFPSEGHWESLVDHLRQIADAARPMTQRTLMRRRDGELKQGEVVLWATPDGFRMGLSEGDPAEEERAEHQEEAQAEQEDLESRAAEAEARLQALTQALPDGVAIVIGESIGSLNPAFAAMLGRPAEELLGRPFTDLLDARDLVRGLGVLSGREGADGEEIDLRVKGAGGAEVTLAATIGHAELGGRPALILSARDVSGRRALEQRLALYSAWLGAAMESSRDGLAVISGARGPHGAPLVLANRAFVQQLGLPADRFPERSDLQRAIDETFAVPEMVHAFLDGFGQEPAASGEGLFDTRGDSPRSLEVRSTPVTDAGGGHVGRLLAVRDLTAQAELEKQLRREAETLQESTLVLERSRKDLERANDEMESRLDDLTRLNQELKELDEMKSNLLGNVSHELHTPLVSIKGYTEMILRGDLGDLTEEQRKGLEVSFRNIERLIGLIDQLLSFSRTEERLAEITLEAFPLWEVLEETIHLLGDRIKEKRLRVTTRYRAERLTVMADRNLVSQILINLLGNAIKYNQENGEVAFTVRSGSQEELVVDVKDTGPGVAREEQEKIFERGFRGSAASGTRGAGIGLALVREILRRHGCQIRVDSRAGEGTTFSFTLPLAADAPPEDASRAREDSSSDRAGARDS